MSGLVCLYFNGQNKVIKSFWEKIFPIFLDYWQAWLLLSQVDASSLIATSASLRDLNYFRNPGIWEKMGDNKKFKKEREKRKGKNKKLQKEEMAWLTQNTRFDKSNINAWHKVSTLCFTANWLHPAIFWGRSWLRHLCKLLGEELNMLAFLGWKCWFGGTSPEFEMAFIWSAFFSYVVTHQIEIPQS